MQLRSDSAISVVVNKHSVMATPHSHLSHCIPVVQQIRFVIQLQSSSKLRSTWHCSKGFFQSQRSTIANTAITLLVSARMSIATSKQ
jgi:hypothetical protein